VSGVLDFARWNVYLNAQQGAQSMTRLLTTEIASMTELREPQKVLDRAGGKPVAVLKNSQLVAYLVPAEAVVEPGTNRVATREEVLAVVEKRRKKEKAVLGYLKEK